VITIRHPLVMIGRERNIALNVKVAFQQGCPHSLTLKSTDGLSSREGIPSAFQGASEIIQSRRVFQKGNDSAILLCSSRAVPGATRSFNSKQTMRHLGSSVLCHPLSIEETQPLPSNRRGFRVHFINRAITGTDAAQAQPLTEAADVEVNVLW
jgi:hypothetical protein